jgi:deoxyadenosine/deoxycytidine kinase
VPGHHPRCKVVIVEGLIGSGKTTLSRELGEALGANTLTLFEPDEKGEDGKNTGNPYLADYYADPARWSFVLQVHQLQARYRMHLQAQWHALQGFGHAVLDRSYFGDTAFARLQLADGYMSPREFDTYASIYQAMTASVMLPTVCVRVLATPEVCERRVAGRMLQETGRTCEQAIDLNYLRGLEREIDHMVGVLKNMGVAVLDMPWDVDRTFPEDRRPAVEALASRIQSLDPPDFFLDMHRRAIL